MLSTCVLHAIRPVASGGAKGGLGLQLGKIPNFSQNDLFLEKFSLRVYILSTFSKFAPGTKNMKNENENKYEKTMHPQIEARFIMSSKNLNPEIDYRRAHAARLGLVKVCARLVFRILILVARNHAHGILS